MKAKRGATALDGVILVDKPTGLTSHDVVDRLRALTQEGRIGHAGTLDPAASGLLVVCIGPSTRLSEQLMGHDKSYVARIVFGQATDTDDAEGQVSASGRLLPQLADADFARATLAGFVGPQEQVPPIYSAIKQAGVAAYKKARAGQPVPRAPRKVTVHEISLLSLDAESWDISCRVSKGTYIRALARDIGERVACPAHLGALRRTAVGPWTVAQAWGLDQLDRLADSPDAWEALFLSPAELERGLQ